MGETLAVKIVRATLASKSLDYCLVEFANLAELGWEFWRRWGEWPRPRLNLKALQEIIRGVWRGGRQSRGEFVVVLNAAIKPLNPLPIYFLDFRRGRLEIEPTNLPMALCLALVRNLRRLAVCKNPQCQAPYFLRKKPNQKFCSEACALPSQREFKRQWWARHGHKWRAGRKKSKTRGAK